MFTVSANGPIAGSLVVTPRSTGNGTFTPTFVTLTSDLPTATFAFTPSGTGRMQISLSNAGGLTNPAVLSYESRAPAPGTPPGPPPATALNLAGPIAGDQGRASGTFTIGANGGIAGSIVVVPTSTGSGSFRPTSLTLSANAPNATFVFTPSGSGQMLIGLSNTSGLTNPLPLPYESRVPTPPPPPGPPPATALYLSGPVSGRQYQASTAFTVSANGNIASAVVVTPATTGSGSFMPRTVTLTAAAPTATFVFTPSGSGAMQISLSNASGLTNPRALAFESRVVPLDNTRPLNWIGDVNPVRPFGSSQGVVPAGSGNKAGQPNLVVALHETIFDDAVVQVRLADRARNITPTEFQRGAVTPTFPTLRRIPDPADATKWAYHHRINKREVGIDGVNVTPENVPDSYRTEVGLNGDVRYTPTGTEEWVVCGIWMPEYWRTLDTRRDWYVLFQYHDTSPGLMNNPPIAVGWSGGNGTASNCKFNWIVRRYNNSSWPASQTRGLNRAVYSGTINSPAANTWHWFIFHTRSGCGYLDPNKGAIYGPTNPNDCFVKLYHAVGNGPADLAGAYTGFWGGPYGTNDPRVRALQPGQAFPENGFWKNGIYLNTKFQPASAGDDRDLISKGHRLYRASDNPGMTAADVLRDFRGV